MHRRHSNCITRFSIHHLISFDRMLTCDSIMSVLILYNWPKCSKKGRRRTIQIQKCFWGWTVQVMNSLSTSMPSMYICIYLIYNLCQSFIITCMFIVLHLYRLKWKQTTFKSFDNSNAYNSCLLSEPPHMHAHTHTNSPNMYTYCLMTHVLHCSSQMLITTRTLFLENILKHFCPHISCRLSCN